MHKKLGAICINIGLILFYIVILILAVKPNTSQEYRMCYIENKLIVWPGIDGLTYQTGDVINYTTPPEGKKINLGNGWSGLETWGTWSQAKENSLYYNTANLVDHLTIEFTANAFMHTRQLQAVVDNEVLCIIDVPIEKTVFSIKIPSTSFAMDGLTELKFLIDVDESPHDINPLNMDTRKLGIALYSAKIIEAV